MDVKHESNTSMNSRSDVAANQLAKIPDIVSRRRDQTVVDHDWRVRIVGIRYLHAQPVLQAVLIAQDDGLAIAVDMPSALQHKFPGEQPDRQPGRLIVQRQGARDVIYTEGGVDPGGKVERVLSWQGLHAAAHRKDGIESNHVVQADIADAPGRELHSRRGTLAKTPTERGRDLEYSSAWKGISVFPESWDVLDQK